MATRRPGALPALTLHCGTSKPSDANTTVDVDKTFEIWARLIVLECNVASAATFSALLQIARRLTYLTRQFKQDYKKDPDLEDMNHWTTGVDEVLDDDNEIEVDHVPVDENLVAALEALDFAIHERYAVTKVDATSPADAGRQ